MTDQKHVASEIDDADLTPDESGSEVWKAQPEAAAKLLDGIPGLPERVRIAKQQIARGEGIPLGDL